MCVGFQGLVFSTLSPLMRIVKENINIIKVYTVLALDERRCKGGERSRWLAKKEVRGREREESGNGKVKKGASLGLLMSKERRKGEGGMKDVRNPE